MKNWKSAAAQGLLRTTGESSVPLAIRNVAGRLLQDVTSPPTDLDTVASRLHATVMSGDIFGSGELRRTADGYEIVYAKDLAVARRRFTVAHELAHIALLQACPGAPTAGKEVERLCDLIAVELLMPLQVFEPSTPGHPNLGDIFALARRFQSSLVATAQRCTEVRSLTIFEVAMGKITWCFGGLRRSTALHDTSLLEHAKRACDGHSGAAVLYLNDNPSLLPARLEYQPLGRSGRALCLLTPISAAAAHAAFAHNSDIAS
jgi:hypothetical protein